MIDAGIFKTTMRNDYYDVVQVQMTAKTINMLANTVLTFE